MIVVKNLSKIVDETSVEPFESAGEMEDFIAGQIKFFLHQTFGFQAKVETQK